MTYFDRSDATCAPDAEVGIRILFPDAPVDQPREIWYEAYVRFDANWHTQFCTSPAPMAERKFLMHYDQANHVGDPPKLQLWRHPVLRT